MTEIDNLPPIIAQMVNNMNNKQNADHIRDNYYVMLERIVEVCSSEMTKFKRERTKINFETRAKKKKVNSNG